MNARNLILVLFVAALAAIIYFTVGGKGVLRLPGAGGPPAGPGSGPGPGSGAGSTPPAAAAGTEVTVLYGTEKQPWMEAAAAEFGKANPQIKITLQARGSLESAQAILDGKARPTVWSPADSLVLGMLAADWQTQNHADLFAAGDDTPQPLVITPLVFAIWEDRARVLMKADAGAVTWRSLRKALNSNQGWPAIGGPADWGFVKLGHTDPTRSNSGLQALLLMTLEYYGSKPTLEVGDLLKPDYQAFIRDIEKGVTRFEPSTGTFMVDMIRFGPSKYDVAVVYESLAIAQLDNAQGRWGSLLVYYPTTTLWSDHPAALLQGDWVSAEQKKAARAFLAFLRSRPMQEKALQFGFRPADPSVPILTGQADDPFTRLAKFGIRRDLPPVARTPDGAVVRNLILMWQRVVGSRAP